MNNKYMFIGSAVAILMIVGALIFYDPNTNVEINDFDSCVLAGNPVMESYPEQCRTPDGQVFTKEENLQEYFNRRIWETAVEINDGAMPIEGYNPDMYMGTYSKLVKSDFNDTLAYGGKWIYSSNSLNFVINESEPISSAQGTLTLEGMEKFLDNLEMRLGINATSKEDIDNIISKIR